MSEKYITIYFDKPIKKIWFPKLSIRMWMYKNGTNQSEIMKKRWQDPEFRKKRSKPRNFSKKTRKKLSRLMKKRMNSDKAPGYFEKMAETRREMFREGILVPCNKLRKEKCSPFYMVDGVVEEIVEMDRKPSYGVVIESQQFM